MLDEGPAICWFNMAPAMFPGSLTEESPVLLISELDGSHPVNRVLSCIDLSDPSNF